MRILNKINICITSFSVNELVKDLANSWELIVLVVGLIILFFEVFYDLIKDGKINKDDKINYVSELNQFGKDLKGYYEQKNKQN